MTAKINILLKIIIFLYLMLFSPFICIASEPDLILSTWTSNPLSNKEHTGFLDQVLIEAFKRIDLRIDIVQKPAERSLRDANHGDDDGDFLRIDGLTRLYPNLIQVPEKIFDIEFVAFSKNNYIKIDGWESLKPYRIGIVIGWKILEENIQDVRFRNDVDNIESIFKMLDTDRIDIAIYSRFLGLETIKILGINNIFINEPPLVIKPMYLYLHKRHEDIIPKLVESLCEMKTDGTFFDIRKQTLNW